MRILVAPQEYKGTLTAVEAAAAMARGLRTELPQVEIDLAPMADGGPGTAEALLTAIGGERRTARVHDPLMRPIDAAWVRLSTGVAVIECASASGLSLLRAHELNPLRASTFGTGELIREALDAGCTELIIGLGGSATNDGGAGMAQALGFRLLDSESRDLGPGGAALSRLDRIDAEAAAPALRTARIRAAGDVRNPLCGPEGASVVYGPQKGADLAAVRELDVALRHFAAVVSRDLGIDVLERPGGGAAGGLGAGVLAFLGGILESGPALVGEAAGIPHRVRAADVVLTGEGRLDGQTSQGKGPAYIAGLARAAARPVACLPGSLGPGHETSRGLFDLVLLLADGVSLPDSSTAAALLEAAAPRAILALGGSGTGR